jgi:hypothetical protein
MEFVTEQIADQQHDYFSVIPWPFLADEFTLIFSLRIPERECWEIFLRKPYSSALKKVEILLKNRLKYSYGDYKWT